METKYFKCKKSSNEDFIVGNTYEFKLYLDKGEKKIVLRDESNCLHTDVELNYLKKLGIEFEDTDLFQFQTKNGTQNREVEKHLEICNELNKTFERKNHDYGNSFSKSYEELGIISSITRISDKYNRLVSLGVKNKEQKVNGEALEDTLLDMANYCIMTYMELTRKEWDK